MIEIAGLTHERVELVRAVQQSWAARISYYFPIDSTMLDDTLFAQPEVHPARFEMEPDASLVAIDCGQPVGWLQAGYVSNIPSIPDGEQDALVRCLMVDEGRTDVARELLDRVLEVLARQPVRAWQAFEHNCGYTFATGIGKAPHRMTSVMAVLADAGFQPGDTNLVYATDSLRPLSTSRAKELCSIEAQVLPRGWSEQGAAVEWDQFNFFEKSEQVGYATVVPVRRLTGNSTEDALFIKGIAVETEHHRRGIGHLIMSTLWDHYHPEGINRLILNTGDENYTAQKFYEAVGFELTDLISSLFISPAK